MCVCIANASDIEQRSMLIAGRLFPETSNRRNLEVACSNHALGIFFFKKNDCHFCRPLFAQQKGAPSPAGKVGGKNSMA